MAPDEADSSLDHFQLKVDGELFQIDYDLTQPGAYHYSRLTGPAPGNGFTSRTSTFGRRTLAHHTASIRAFLQAVDPLTGYIEDDE